MILPAKNAAGLDFFEKDRLVGPVFEQQFSGQIYPGNIQALRFLFIQPFRDSHIIPLSFQKSLLSPAASQHNYTPHLLDSTRASASNQNHLTNLSVNRY